MFRGGIRGDGNGREHDKDPLHDCDIDECAVVVPCGYEVHRPNYEHECEEERLNGDDVLRIFIKSFFGFE